MQDLFSMLLAQVRLWPVFIHTFLLMRDLFRRNLFLHFDESCDPPIFNRMNLFYRALIFKHIELIYMLHVYF